MVGLHHRHDRGVRDRYPVTVTGRFVAVGVMLVGIALVGAVTATIAAWLVEQVEEAQARSRSTGDDG